MAGYSIISDVGNALVKLLRSGLVPELIPNSDAIGLCSPEERGDMALGIHLYDIRQSEEAVGGGMRSDGESSQRYPSQFLTLYYMITAYSSSDLKFRAAQEQRILGRTIQILGDYSVLREEFLGEGARNSAYPVRVEMMRMDNEEKVKMWNRPDMPYRLSLYYRVFPVEIESTRVRSVRRVVDVDFSLDEKR